ncbi:MAG: hypothetical protein ACLUIQ_10395 [Dialister invisus]
MASSYTRQKELDMWRSLGYPVVMIDGPTSIAQAERIYASSRRRGGNGAGERWSPKWNGS